MKKKQSTFKKLKNDYDLYLMFLIPVVVLFIFKYVPIFFSAIAFQNFNLFKGIFASKWVGLDNFVRLFNSDEFPIILRNTIVINLYRIIWVFPLPIILALLFNEIRSRAYQKTVQTVMILPHFLSWVVVTGLFVVLLRYDGIINRTLVKFGIEKIDFLTAPEWFRTINVTQSAWKEVGYSSIIYISAIAAIDPQLYEAAKIDGASKMQLIWHITIPGIASTIILMFLIKVSSITSSRELQEQILNMYNPAVYETADVIGTYVYRNGLGKMEYSYYAAVDLFSSVVGVALIFIGNKMSRKLIGRSIW